MLVHKGGQIINEQLITGVNIKLQCRTIQRALQVFYNLKKEGKNGGGGGGWERARGRAHVNQDQELKVLYTPMMLEIQFYCDRFAGCGDIHV